MTEAARQLEAYESLEALFIRELKQNLRTVSGSYVASADGRLEVSRPADGMEAIQAKGITYGLNELLYGSSSVPQEQSVVLPGAKPAWYTTIYLAPHNYHRVHAPFEGKVIGLRYIPGQLWPVNRLAVCRIPQLFVKNERLVFEFELAAGARGWLVMVGALNVGRMSTKLAPGFVTNSLRRVLSQPEPYQVSQLTTPGWGVQAGDEIGIFMLGSTTVVVLDDKAVAQLKPREISSQQSIVMGENLSV